MDTNKKRKKEKPGVLINGDVCPQADRTVPCRVIGVRVNGARIVLSQHASRPIAENVVSQIRIGSEFAEFLIESGEWGQVR